MRSRVLGFDMVINLALAGFGRNFTVPKDGARGYTPFWQQSVMTAALCNELVRIMPVRLRPNAGLMYLWLVAQLWLFDFRAGVSAAV